MYRRKVRLGPAAVFSDLGVELQLSVSLHEI